MRLSLTLCCIVAAAVMASSTAPACPGNQQWQECPTPPACAPTCQNAKLGYTLLPLPHSPPPLSLPFLRLVFFFSFLFFFLNFSKQLTTYPLRECVVSSSSRMPVHLLHPFHAVSSSGNVLTTHFDGKVFFFSLSRPSSASNSLFAIPSVPGCTPPTWVHRVCEYSHEFVLAVFACT